MGRISPCLRLGAALLLSASACGARSDLPACTPAGETRPCEDACGAGSQTCQGGRWGACIVAPTSRACSNDCGDGTQRCVDGAWSPCDVPVAVRACSSACGQGQQGCFDGGWQACDAALPGPPTLLGTVRDFDDTHPDFEPDGGIPGVAPGIVAAVLGADDRPVYTGAIAGGYLGETHGASAFAQWYRDLPSIDLRGPPLPIPLVASPADKSVYVYENDNFFPIDNQLLGNQGRPHNFDFTFALVVNFRYTGGETFRFASDDDSFVFINRHLAIDLGGIHQARFASVDLDSRSRDFGIIAGTFYPMHLFYAERHVINAALHIEVPAADFAVCAPEAMP